MGTRMDNEKRAHRNTCGATCSIVLTEGELTDLQGIESWLYRSEEIRPRLGRGVRKQWLKTLAHILDKSNAQGHTLARSAAEGQ